MIREMSMDAIHRSLERTPAGQPVMCVDFRGRDRDLLDLDFVVTPDAAGELHVSEIRIHKLNGVERKQ